ncbi:hypothetical protein DFR69_106222 [Nocardia neocaledoniensis]|uniref:Uncharacterized protein n=1 Tax=Nocardia neocaledoniensis TaxID=236511 RepID=A0A317NGG9_9NOCA|nr:hypothetical protein DFR69_106222 [Nocardia neocaledoniensis]
MSQLNQIAAGAEALIEPVHQIDSRTTFGLLDLPEKVAAGVHRPTQLS